MHPSLLSVVAPIASIFCFRMLGLFMLIPVFTRYADDLSGSTALTMGIALGIYGLTQGMLQIPFGMLSDRIGRKKVILLGLLLFFLGSIVSATATSINLMIIGRALQGMGAIGSTLIALLSDLTPHEQRTKSMAFLGMSIGISFALAMVFSPLIAKHYGLSGIFSLTALFALLGIFILYAYIPNPKREVVHKDSATVPKLFGSVLRNSELLKLDLGIFFQHAILTATFYIIPILLEHKISKQWQLYLPILTLSFLVMVPLIIYGEKKRSMKFIMNSAIAITFFAQTVLLFSHNSLTSISLLLFVYFIGFNVLEACLPSLVSKVCDIHSKGTAMGVYSSSQFMGIFCGGIIAGSFYHHFGSGGIFIANCLMSLAWLFIALSMKKPKYLSSHIVSFSSKHLDKKNLLSKLLAIEGVEDVLISAEENLIYFKIDKHTYEQGRIEYILN